MDGFSFAAGFAACFLLLTAERALRRQRAILPAVPAAPTSGPFSDLAGKSAGEVAELFRGLPDREAVVLIHHLDPVFADDVLSHLLPDRQDALIDLLQKPVPTHDAEVARVANLVRLRLGRPVPPAPPGPPATAPLAFLAGMPAEQVAAKLNAEAVYHAAYVVKHLPDGTRERVMALLEPGVRAGVKECLGDGTPVLKISGETFAALLARLRAA